MINDPGANQEPDTTLKSRLGVRSRSPHYRATKDPVHLQCQVCDKGTAMDLESSTILGHVPKVTKDSLLPRGAAALLESQEKVYLSDVNIKVNTAEQGLCEATG